MQKRDATPRNLFERNHHPAATSGNRYLWYRRMFHHERSDERAFVECLEQAGVPVTVREPRGGEIDGACGQLAANLDKRAEDEQVEEEQ